MQKWQYLSIEVEAPVGERDFRAYSVNGRKLPKWDKGPMASEYLDQLGAEGWELAGVGTNTVSLAQILYFKRPTS